MPPALCYWVYIHTEVKHSLSAGPHRSSDTGAYSIPAHKEAELLLQISACVHPI